MSTCQRIRIPCNIRCDLNRKAFMTSERPISCRSSRPHIWSYLYNEVESHHCWSPCTTNATYLLTAAVGSRPVSVEWRGGKLVICSQRCFIDDDNRITRVFDNSETPPCVGVSVSSRVECYRTAAVDRFKRRPRQSPLSPSIGYTNTASGAWSSHSRASATLKVRDLTQFQLAISLHEN